MEKLAKTEKIKGAGIPDLTATLVDRTNKKAWYVRSDGVHEVFKIKIEKEKEIFGRHYPEQEKYPGNEDFGKWAWCFSGKNARKDAREYYNKLG
jgi:hypothetical protein